MPSVGPVELAIVLVVVMLLFGAKRLPEIGRSLGGGIRELKDSLTVQERSVRAEEELPSAEKDRRG